MAEVMLTREEAVAREEGSALNKWRVVLLFGDRMSFRDIEGNRTGT
jgi:hypothetical protein